MRCPEDPMPEVRTKKSSNSLPCQSDLEGRRGGSPLTTNPAVVLNGQVSEEYPALPRGPESAGPGGRPASHLQQWALEQGEQAALTSRDIVFFF